MRDGLPVWHPFHHLQGADPKQEDRVDLRMGTFSKSLASCGGFVAGPGEVVEFLRFSSRAFLFTASGVPAATGAALAALRIVRSAEGEALLAAVLDRAKRWRDGLDDLGFAVVSPQTLPDGSEIVTPIIPVLVGDDWKAALLWRASRPAARCCARA